MAEPHSFLADGVDFIQLFRGKGGELFCEPGLDGFEPVFAPFHREGKASVEDFGLHGSTSLHQKPSFCFLGERNLLYRRSLWRNALTFTEKTRFFTLQYIGWSNWPGKSARSRKQSG